MHRHDGVGLAAPQVGVNVNMLVMNEAGTPEDGDEIVMVNPEIVELENDLESFEEGCLSFPGIYADVVVRCASEWVTRVNQRAEAVSLSPAALSTSCRDLRP